MPRIDNSDLVGTELNVPACLLHPCRADKIRWLKVEHSHHVSAAVHLVVDANAVGLSVARDPISVILNFYSHVAHVLCPHQVRQLPVSAKGSGLGIVTF